MTKTPGAKALMRGVVFSTAAVAGGDTICQWCVRPNEGRFRVESKLADLPVGVCGCM